MRHTRLADIVTLAELAARYPTLCDHVGAACDETAPELLFVRSYPR